MFCPERVYSRFFLKIRQLYKKCINITENSKTNIDFDLKMEYNSLIVEEKSPFVLPHPSEQKEETAMQDSIEQIISTDQKARKLLDDIALTRQNAEKELKQKQTEIREKMLLEAKDRIQKDNDAEWEKSQANMEQKRESNVYLFEQMDSIYAEKKDTWVADILKKVLE
jgi:hypothetical protein